MIAIIDYNAGNLKSVEKALHFLGEDCVITRNFHEIETADKVILPGVGAFGDAMEQLKKYELDKVIHQVTAENKPFLGICLGLQLLFEGSDESQGVEGLHVLDGQILRIPDQSGLKIPHIGWNSLHLQNDGRLFAGLEENPYVYFVHSYYLKVYGIIQIFYGNPVSGIQIIVPETITPYACQHLSGEFRMIIGRRYGRKDNAIILLPAH